MSQENIKGWRQGELQKPFRPLYSLNLLIPFLSIHHLTTSLPIGSEVKASAWNVGDPGLVPGSA